MGLLTLLRKLKRSDREARLLVLGEPKLHSNKTFKLKQHQHVIVYAFALLYLSGLDNSGKTTILKKLSEEDITVSSRAMA